MELRSKVLTGMKWVAGAKMASQLFSWTVTLVVVRLLSPADYGLMALATLVLSLLTLLAEMGLGAAIVQRTDLTKQQIRQSFGLILVLNFSLCVLLNLSATTIASFFGAEQLGPVIQLMSVGFVISAFIIIPDALLEKELKYKSKSLVLLVASLFGAIITLTLALLGHGVWSLVWGQIAMILVKTVGLNIIRPLTYRPSFSLNGMKEIISFSSMVAAERSILLLYSQADTFIVGKIFGKDLLGIYSVSMHLASLPMQKISGMINQVAFPAFATIQSDSEKIKHYVLKVVRIISFMTFPVFWGISCVSPEIVKALLGVKWEEAIIPLQILTLVMPIRMIGNMSSPILRGIGRANVAVVNLIIASIIMTISFLVGTTWGILGVALAWLLTYPIVFLILMHRAGKVLNVSLVEIIRSMIRPALAATGMYTVVILTRSLLPEQFEPILQLIVLAIAGGISYATFIFIIANDVSKEILGFVRK